MRRRDFPWFVLLATVALPAPARAQAQARPDERFRATWAPIAKALRAELETNGVVGGSVWFLKGGEILAREFHGFADLATRRRVDADTIFHWASVTKTMTGIVTMQLVERGKLSLDDRIIDHLSALKKVHGGEWDIGAVTIRHLLTHSSGFRENTFPWGGEPWHPYEPTEWTQLAAMFPYTKLHFEPGSKYSYSNPGIVFVGRVIEQQTGEDFEVHVDKNVLKPLGMHRSFFDDTPYHLRAHRSNNYAFRDGKHVANGLDLDTGITVSNGGLNAPVPDMVRYAQFLMGRPTALALPRATLEAMWKPVHAAGEAGSFTRSMGTTFFVCERNGTRVIGHTGSQRAFQCFLLVDPKAGTAAIAAFNSASKTQRTTRAIMLAFLNTILERVMPIWQ